MFVFTCILVHNTQFKCKWPLLWPQLNFHVLSISSHSVSAVSREKKLQIISNIPWKARIQNENKNKKLFNQINFKAAWVMLHYTGSRTNHIFGAYICSVGIMQSGVTILMNLHFDSMYISLTISELMFSSFSGMFLNLNIFFQFEF